MKKTFFAILTILFSTKIYNYLDDLRNHPDLRIEMSGLPYESMQIVKKTHSDIISTAAQNFQIQNKKLYELILENKDKITTYTFLKIKPSEDQNSTFVIFFLEDLISFRRMYGLCTTSINSILKLAKEKFPQDEKLFIFLQEAERFFNNTSTYIALKNELSCSWEACERTMQTTTTKKCWIQATPPNFKDDLLFKSLLKIFAFLESYEESQDCEFEQIHSFEEELKIIKANLTNQGTIDYYESVYTILQDTAFKEKLLDFEIFTEEELLSIGF